MSPETFLGSSDNKGHSTVKCSRTNNETEKTNLRPAAQDDSKAIKTRGTEDPEAPDGDAAQAVIEVSQAPRVNFG